ncbi:MAG: hypothetical protein B6I38_06335 [Anaerolineaceae bacterium 4572_5.1]|nr:MAG: hypothetical protein B6I38_06335 [Anaerolineaceae bacterium 4572_5.1]
MPEWVETSVTVLTLIAMLIGLFGLIVPIFPGLVIIWLAALVFGLVHGFTTLGWVIFGVMTVLMIIGNTADGILMGAKALEHGASKRSIVLTLVAGIGVSLVLSPLGGLIAAPLTLYLSEKSNGHSSEEAWAITRGLMIGWGWSFVLRFIIGLMMIILWIIWA